MKALIETLQKVKDAKKDLIHLTQGTINQVLESVSEKLLENEELILKENQKDLDKLDKSNAKYDRLKLTPMRIKAISDDLLKVADIKSPVGDSLFQETLTNGLVINKVSVPLGTVGIIYESRPNVTCDVFALCFKTQNACVLKGGSEAHNTNTILVSIIQGVLRDFEIDDNSLILLSPDRKITQDLLKADQYLDVIIPRGSYQLIDFVRTHAKVPVIETGAGIVHIYIDEFADLKKAKDIIFNAKTRRVSVCNALDTLIIHKKLLKDLPEIVEALKDKEVEIFADNASYNELNNKYPEKLLKKATNKEFGIEFLSFKMAICTVKDMQEAINHIRNYSSKHSEAIVSENKHHIHDFFREVDSACLYANASTAFTDGAQFGFGAEVGISTQKLHARGPMGLSALTSYKWLIEGDGHIRT